MLRAAALKNTADAAGAGALIDAAMGELPTAPLFHGVMNIVFDVLIALGRYREALGLEPAMRARRDWQWSLAQANLAEAEYCQGLLKEAGVRLSNPAIDAAAGRVAIAKSGVALQRAWLAVQLGDSAGALARVASVSPADCPRSYRAEWYFTAAAAHSLAGHVREADVALAAGTRLALRSSSVRNALALKGALLRSRGDLEDAEHWLARAAGHRWKGQSGGLLLAWGDVLNGLGRAAEARAAWSLAAVQDPQSEAAALAAKR